MSVSSPAGRLTGLRLRSRGFTIGAWSSTHPLSTSSSDRGKAYKVSTEDTPGAQKVWVVGRIPYERIKYRDWEPDPNYGAPRFYVTYGWRRNPFHVVVLYEDAGWNGYQY